MFKLRGVWIRDLGVIEYTISDTKMITGGFENALCVNNSILLTKKFFTTQCKMESTHIYKWLRMK